MNVAVSVDGVKPMSCASRLIAEPVIRLQSLRIKSTDHSNSSTNNNSNSDTEENEIDFSGDTGPLKHWASDVLAKKAVYEGDCVDCWTAESFSDVSNPHAAAALLKAVLIVLGVVSLPNSSSSSSSTSSSKQEGDHNASSNKSKRAKGLDLKEYLLGRFGGGIEVVCVSALPAGSGMGGSSILAATVLKSVATLLGLPCSNTALIYQVLAVEQTLTTGGGWQDQIGAIFGGFKIARSPASLPLQVTVDPLPVSDRFLSRFQSRCLLVFTGTQRLAKNTLINALHKHALTPTSGIPGSSIADLLARHAELAAKELAQQHHHCVSETSAITDVDIDAAVDRLGHVLSHYWLLKRAMAEGCEPPYISRLMHHLSGLCVGLSLCGAGAGGFLVAILKADVDRNSFQRALSSYIKTEETFFESQKMKLSIHQVMVDKEGISARTYEDHQGDLSDFLFA